MQGIRNTENATMDRTRKCYHEQDQIKKRTESSRQNLCNHNCVRGKRYRRSIFSPTQSPSAGTQILKTLYNRCATSLCIADAFSPILPSRLLRKRNSCSSNATVQRNSKQAHASVHNKIPAAHSTQPVSANPVNALPRRRERLNSSM